MQGCNLCLQLRLKLQTKLHRRQTHSSDLSAELNHCNQKPNLMLLSTDINLTQVQPELQKRWDVL